MADPIDFYFDFASPYGYFASLQIDELAARHGRSVCWRPVLLGAIFKVTGMKPNLEQPLRGEYLTHDAGRIARLLGCPFRFPDVMPVNAVNPSRAVWWLAGRSEAQARRLAAALYHAHWGEGRDISRPEVVAEVASANGHNAAEVTAAMQDPVVKDRLRVEVDQAVARGVFGSPFVIVDDEPFWGWDRLPMVERWLETGGW